ncbi:FxsA family protein [Marinicrinis sediminis]|uniref:FxsA family protein n=1 Tax=Marinicrinis sediminis TaxID=1652465 RepID=A0ABW5R997_9BACL
MFKWIMLIMIVVPAIEIWGLLTVGSWIGGLPTFLLILLTGFAGALLAKKEASRVWRDASRQMSAGQVPGQSILDGLCIFAGGLLLLTPGFFTDLLGFLLVVPFSRIFFRHGLMLWLSKRIASGNIRFFRR